MEDLEYCRIEIDKIDMELVLLFEKRMEIVKKVAEYKKINNLPILNTKREKEVILKNLAFLKNNNYTKITQEFFENIMKLSKTLQKDIIDFSEENKIKVGYQGVCGSFSEEALIKYFKNYDEVKNYEEFIEVFEALKNNEINYGVLPIENSYTGAITEVYDLLVKYNFFVIGEECLKINQHLLGVEGTIIENVKEIYSHPQGFAQSKGFLNKLTDIKLIPYYNTAISAKYVAEIKDNTKCAIGSKRASEIYGLEILKENINDNKDNYTKFIIVGKKLKYNIECNKISIVFSLEDKAGTLYNLLRYFAENNINMLKIESRPNKNTSWKYLLYVDFEGNLEDISVKNALNLIEKNSVYFKIIGNYKKFLD